MNEFVIFSIQRIGRYFEWKTMGALYWQLNDVWIAPSWSSIEYNGNFKVLQYWAKEFFAPLHIVANVDALNSLNVFVVRDTLGKPQEFNVRIRTFLWSSLNPVSDFNLDVSMVKSSLSDFHSEYQLKFSYKTPFCSQKIPLKEF